MQNRNRVYFAEIALDNVENELARVKNDLESVGNELARVKNELETVGNELARIKSALETCPRGSSPILRVRPLALV